MPGWFGYYRMPTFFKKQYQCHELLFRDFFSMFDDFLMIFWSAQRGISKNHQINMAKNIGGKWKKSLARFRVPDYRFTNKVRFVWGYFQKKTSHSKKKSPKRQKYYLASFFENTYNTYLTCFSESRIVYSKPGQGLFSFFPPIFFAKFIWWFFEIPCSISKNHQIWQKYYVKRN